MINRLLTAAMLLSLSIPSAWADHHEADKPPRTITVSGEGKVKVKPDTASISAGVVTEAETAREALNKNNDQMQEVMAGMREAGIAEDGYRIIMNCNKHGGQEVFHIHMHLLGGCSLGPMLSINS